MANTGQMPESLSTINGTVDLAIWRIDLPMNQRCLRTDWTTIVVCVAIFAATAGCSERRPQTYPVSGIVRFSDGKPVRMGTVEFRSVESGLNARGKIDGSGRFQLGTFETADGAVAGVHQVIVTQIIGSADARRPPKGHQHTSAIAKVAPRHARYETSGLTAKVNPGEENAVQIVVEIL